MFTQCPNCQSRYNLTSAQLREHRGMIRCENCDTLFDALQLVHDNDNEQTIIKPSESVVLPWEKPPIKLSIYWAIGLIINILLLLGQSFYFEARTISQNPKFRPSLEKVAAGLHHPLPLYQNPDELTVLNSSFEKQSDNSHLLKVSIINQAEFSQAYPKIKLILLNEAGNSFSHRVFKPSDYLAPALVNTTLLSDASVEIALAIAAPKTPIGGYAVELLY
ncbi:MAG: DUF3426 domain-containing protein [Methylococcaceae bacterium]